MKKYGRKKFYNLTVAKREDWDALMNDESRELSEYAPEVLYYDECRADNCSSAVRSFSLQLLSSVYHAQKDNLSSDEILEVHDALRSRSYTFVCGCYENILVLL